MASMEDFENVVTTKASDGVADWSDSPLARNLTEADNVPEHISCSGLPADFRVQMQMLYGMTQQRKLLQDLVENHGQLHSQLEDMRQDIALHQNLALQPDLASFEARLFSALERTEGKIDKLPDELLLRMPLLPQREAMSKMPHGEDTVPASEEKDRGDASLRQPMKLGAISRSLDVGTVCSKASGLSLCDGPISKRSQPEVYGKAGTSYWEESLLNDCDAFDSAGTERQEASISERLNSRSGRLVRTASKLKNLIHEEATRNGVRGAVKTLVGTTFFECICAVVIILNSIWMGLSASSGLAHALENVGQGDSGHVGPEPHWMANAFWLFYVFELLLKIYAFRCSFFTDKDNAKWNWFDFILVLSGGYDVLMEMLQVTPINVTWMRLLRLAKMAKMLRVVRVMKIFQQMRTMLKSIAQSFMTMFWAILVILTIMYVFGLCFLFGITGYLNTTPPSDIKPETMANIDSYWSSIGIVLISLFMSLTGGADWEVIAEPLKQEGMIYYGLFLFFITFGVITVMNVLTGLIVDNAMQASVQDEREVVSQLFVDRKEEISALRNLFRHDPQFRENHTIEWATIQKDLDENKVKGITYKFLEAMDISASDAYRVFSMFQHVGSDRILLDSFITGCAKARGSQLGVEMFSLTAQTKRLMGQIEVLMKYCEDRFDEHGPCQTEPLLSRLDCLKLTPLTAKKLPELPECPQDDLAGVAV